MNNITEVVIYLVIALLIIGIFIVLKKYFDNSKSDEFKEKIDNSENINEPPKPVKIKEPKNYRIKPNSKSNPMTIQEFNKELEHWLNHNDYNNTIGDIKDYGGRAFLYVKNGNSIFHLNADTKRSAVAQYISNYKNEKWNLVFNARKTKKNKVAFGSDSNNNIIKGFYLYLLGN